MITEFQGTPGPWRWELNLKSKDLQLCGHGECGPYDFIVMDFERWGMAGAVPRFREGDMNTMVKAFEFAELAKGREHHKHWFQNINHADANLIAAAPCLLDACMQLMKVYEDKGHLLNFDVSIMRNVVNKALGNK